MILNFNRKEFSINKFEIKDVDGENRYWGIYDFSYKRRLRIFDKDNNELAYIQYRVSSLEKGITFYDVEDNKIAYIGQQDNLQDIVVEPDNWKIVGDVSNWDIRIIAADGRELMSTNDKTHEINIMDDSDVLKCVFCVLAIADENELRVQ